MIIKTIIVGLGNIGLLYDYKNKFIKTHSKAIDENKKFDLIGAIDPNKTRRSYFVKKYQVNCYSNLNKKLIKETDLAVIAVPTKILFSSLKKILRINPRLNILIEKPFAINKNEISFLLNHFKYKKIYINYYRNFDVRIFDLQKLIINKIKKPLEGELIYTKGFLHNGSHFLALFSLLFGKIKKLKIINKKKYHHDYLIEAILYYEDLKLRIKPVSKKFNSFKFYGKNGKLFYNQDGSKISYNLKEKEKLKLKNFSFLTNIDNYQKIVYDNIYKNLVNKKSQVFDLNSALFLNKEIKKFNLDKKNA